MVSKGPLWAQFIVKNGELKINHMEFSCKGYEEYVPRQFKQQTSKNKAAQSNLIVPESPINEWGLPPSVYHFLEVKKKKREHG